MIANVLVFPFLLFVYRYVQFTEWSSSVKGSMARLRAMRASFMGWILLLSLWRSLCMYHSGQGDSLDVCFPDMIPYIIPVVKASLWTPARIGVRWSWPRTRCRWSRLADVSVFSVFFLFSVLCQFFPLCASISLLLVHLYHMLLDKIVLEYRITYQE